MFKSMYARISLVIVSLFVMVHFQNCAPGKKDESVFDSMTNADTTDQIHRDNDHGTLVPTQEKAAMEVSKSLLDRSMVYSLFIDIFGPDAAAVAALNQLRSERAVFGGPCSIYENFKSARAGFKMDSEAESCANSETANNLAAPVNPVANVLQQALINDVCQQMMLNTKTFNYAIAQVKENASVAIPANTPANVLKVFRLFYRGKPEPEASLVTSLQVLVGEPATADGWKNAITTTCVSSHWQAL
ncbi:hypothetical protein CIK05_04555 [Bdellovibrio sp. qaytius]|nr:hypothetical protein CIK05_04555 [Bdellovibrio sp. qaytius]